MDDQLIPEGVQRFILRKIDSIAQLEGLLTFYADPQLKGSAAFVAKRLYIDEAEALLLLDDLCAGGFISAVGDGTYRYDPRTDEIRDMVVQVADLYSRYLVPVTNLIHTKKTSRIQEFADAFRIRKDKD